MNKNISNSRRAIRARARKRRQPLGLIPFTAIIAGGILLMTAGWYLLGDRGNRETAFAYSPEEVIYNQPLRAIHEMGSQASVRNN